MSKTNSLHVIHQYIDHGSLVFDDPSVGLVGEPFVMNTDEILKTIAAAIPGCSKKFTLIFSHLAFPGHQLKATRQEAAGGGYWYRWSATGETGWLCPALFKYFKTAPKTLYVQIKAQTK